jgi:hypothetical protein
MEQIKPKKTSEIGQIIAYVEKDRTGVLSGRSFINPTFDSLCKPILPLLGKTQAQMETVDEAAVRDADAIAQDEAERAAESTKLLREHTAKILAAADNKALKEAGAGITKQLKARMIPQDVEKLREAYLAREVELPKG